MALHSSYVEEVRDNLNYVATWLPSVILQPGDVCDMRGGELRRVGDLEAFGVQCETKEFDVETDIHYASEGAVSMSVKVKGELPKTGSTLQVEDAGVSFSFDRSGAVVLQLTGCTSLEIKCVS